jgi:hypothetical protein
MTIKIVPNEKGNPPGKLADAELHFTDGVLDGLKLIGFSVWERRSGNGRNVTFPARQYSVNGDRRSFAPSATTAPRIAFAISCCRRTPSTRRRPARPLRNKTAIRGAFG